MQSTQSGVFSTPLGQARPISAILDNTETRDCACVPGEDWRVLVMVVTGGESSDQAMLAGAE